MEELKDETDELILAVKAYIISRTYAYIVEIITELANLFTEFPVGKGLTMVTKKNPVFVVLLINLVN